MAMWADIGYMDSNTPSMEQMVFFYDHSMFVIIFILLFLMIFIIFMKVSVINLSMLESQIIEIVWTVIPVFMLMFIAMPSLRLLYLMEENFVPSMCIKVLGHQWFWTYEYEEFELIFDSYIDWDMTGESFRLLESDVYFAIPMNIMVRLLISSVDVIHSWTIQSMGVKTDALPGRLNQVNLFSLRPGFYFGQCSEICGAFHSFMPISLKVMLMEDFVDWIDF